MITLTVGGQQWTVSSGRLTMPRTGVWVADLVADADSIPTGGGTVTLAGVDMPAHVQRAASVNGMLHLRVVGGAGGMGRLARPKHYRNPTVNHVLMDLAADAGERLSSSCTASSIGTSLGHWTSLRVATGALLQALADVVAHDCTWRILYDGSLWFGQETWPQCPAEVRILQIDAWNASQVVGSDALAIWPGTTVGGRRVDVVVHDFGPEPRSKLFFSEAHS